MTTHGEARAGWVRLIVRKKRSRSLQIAADADVSLDAKPVGLPGSANEFLGALLGVRVKNWLNVVDQVRELSDWDALEKELDDLAKQFVGAWIGKAFDELKKTDLPEILAKIRRSSTATTTSRTRRSRCSTGTSTRSRR